MFDKIEGTDVGVLLEADCANTVDDCRAACESTAGCCGFNFIWNPGQYDSQLEGRCVAKACDGRIGTSRYGMVFYQRDAGAVPASPLTPPSPTPSLPPTSADPCFPSSATVIKADGTSARIDSLKEGDEIVAATADGTLTTDTLTLLSIDMPDTNAAVYVTIATAANTSLTLTPTHHVPVGATCCSTLKQAKEVEVGDKVWAVKDGMIIMTTITATTIAKASGLHSPVLATGGFPVVDGIVTAFDSIDKVTLAKHGLAPLLKACKATDTCKMFQNIFFSADDRKHVTTQ